jgi:hypothetical protein
MHQSSSRRHLIQGSLRVFSKILGKESVGTGNGEEKRRGNIRGAGLSVGGDGLVATEA